MKRIVFLFILNMMAMQLQAQGKWQIVLNKKILLTAAEMNDSLNTRFIKSSDWKSKSYLEVNYTEATPSEWIKSIRFTDEEGNEVLKKENTTKTKVPVSQLRRLMAGKKTLRIYISIEPPNPMMMAPAKMITLCILKLP